MENGDGRMRLCGIAVAFSTFLHLLYHIKHNGVFQAQYLLRSFFFHISGFRQNCTAAKEAVLPLDAHLRDVPFPFRVLSTSPVEHADEVFDRFFVAAARRIVQPLLDHTIKCVHVSLYVLVLLRTLRRIPCTAAVKCAAAGIREVGEMELCADLYAAKADGFAFAEFAAETFPADPQGL